MYSIYVFQILAMKKYCPRYNEELQRFEKSPEMQEYNKNHAELYEYVSTHSGARIRNPDDIERVYNSLFIEELYNLTLPDWTKKVYPDQMKPVAAFSFTTLCKTHLLKRLKVGKFLHKFLGAIH